MLGRSLVDEPTQSETERPKSATSIVARIFPTERGEGDTCLWSSGRLWSSGDIRDAPPGFPFVDLRLDGDTDVAMKSAVFL